MTVLGRCTGESFTEKQDVGVLLEDRLLVAESDGGGTRRDLPRLVGQFGNRCERFAARAEPQAGPAVEGDRAESGVDSLDLFDDAALLGFGRHVQAQDRARCLLGDESSHPFVGGRQLAFVDAATQRDVVVDTLVEIVAVVGDRVGKLLVVGVEDSPQLVARAASVCTHPITLAPNGFE
ncbi:Uncharacterised protein [Mycobacteroides abscessus subsp. abscessus]|nr:Uncharacterised protein [Mycobacteroides abscessus subsp. abscessus]